MSQPYRTLFVGTLVQDSFLSVGGREDPVSSLDSPFCLDGLGRPTLRGTGLAGALVATLRRMQPVPATISGSRNGRQPSVWRCFNSHPPAQPPSVVRQHVAIDARTGAAATGMLFDVETLPPGTRWPFLLEVDTSRDPEAADLARQVLGHWTAGRCLLGREAARGLGWLHLEHGREYVLTSEHLEQWPCACDAHEYPGYIAAQFQAFARPIEPAATPLPDWCEISGTLTAGEYKPNWHGDGEAVWGLDSLSIGGHASEELAANEELVTAWSDRFLSPDGLANPGTGFDPDFAVVTCERLPYIPGSSLRGPLRHALARLLRARGETGEDKDDDPPLVKALFGTIKERSAKLLIQDAFPDLAAELRLAWFQHHAEDEFTASTYDSGKFDRMAVMQGCFRWRMVLEDADEEERQALRELLMLAENGWIGIGGGQWRGHGWLHWQIDRFGDEEI